MKVKSASTVPETQIPKKTDLSNVNGETVFAEIAKNG